MEKLGVIDLGSNSVRLLLINIWDDLSYKVIDELKETVRLGDGFSKDGSLRPSRVEKALKTLRMFKNLCDAQNVTHIVAVATAAVRKASNGDDFLKLVHEELKIPLEVISGEEEAYLDYVGVTSSMDVSNALILDIGGGSSELILVKNRKLINSISLPLGSIDLAQSFNIQEKLSFEEEKRLTSFLKSELESLPWLSEARGYPLIGVGGTLRNIGKISRNQKSYPLNMHHNYFMEKDEITRIYNRVKSLSLVERKKIPGLSEDRADIFVGSMALVNTLFEMLNLSSLRISGKGVREGLAFKYLIDKGSSIDSPLDFSLNNIAKVMGLNIPHSLQVYNLAQKLCHELKPLINIDRDFSKILKTASLLHDSGVVINYYSHSKNSFYTVINAPINGLTHRELIMSAYIASLHGKSRHNLDWDNYRLLLDPTDIDLIRKLGLILRIAESLDRSLCNKVDDLKCEIHKDKVILTIFSMDSAELEINDAVTSCEYFKRIFKRDLFII